MPTYQFEAMDSQGKLMRDEIEATSAQEALEKIRGKGLYPTKITEAAAKKQESARPKSTGFAIGGVRSKDITTFTRQLSTLQDAGLPIVRSLRILESQMKPGVFKNILAQVTEDVEGGNTLSEAMAKHPKAFDKLYVNMVRAGEAGGVLDTILQRLADFREKSQRLKKRVIGAMIYPVAVISIATLILSGIMVYIIPKFTKMFKEMNVELPTPTKMLIAVSHFMANYWYYIPLIPFGIFVILKVIGMFEGGRYVLDWIKLKLPIFGTIVNKSVVARFTRTLGTLVASGVQILEALNITKETAGNAVIAKAIGNVHDSIREGEPMAEPLAQAKVVDPMVVHMIDVGEETGDLDKMLIKVADTYDEDVDNAVASMMSLMEPIIIIFMGGAIGSIVISLFLPLIKLMESLGGK